METLTMVLLMYFSLLGANVSDPTPVTTVEQGLVEIREMFPEWEERYEQGEFDCSEMSSFVVTYFHFNGMDAEMQRGWNSRREVTSHAWVLVEGQIVEATSLTIRPDVAHFEMKIPFKEKERYTYTRDIDWWNSNYIREVVGLMEFQSMKLSDDGFDYYYNQEILRYTNDVKK